MVRQTPSSLSHENVFQPKDSEVPQILAAAWAVCTPADKPLRDQLNSQEKTFLILFSEYILTALDSPLSATDPDTVLSDILMTARHRLSLLSKEVSLSAGFVVIVTLLQLLANLFSADNMKYRSLESFLEAYPVFQERSNVEKEKLFHTANWMHILFQITTAKKNKGLVMSIIPKFVEGNGVQYVTGSGQTQPTKDRVTLYETEGNVKPSKRLHRKSKQEILELTKQGGNGKKSSTKTRKTATYVKRKTFSDVNSSDHGSKTAMAVVARPKSSRAAAKRASVCHSHSPSVQFMEEGHEEDELVEQQGEDKNCENMMTESAGEAGSSSSSDDYSNSSQNSQQYLPLPLSFMMAPPMPVRRSESSFSQAAALIASFNNSATYSFNSSAAPSSTAPPSYVKSPREFYLDVEANGTMRKSSASWGSLASLVGSTSSPRAGAGTGADSQSQGQLLPESQYQDQLQMLREVSEDSDFSQQSGGEGGPGGLSQSHVSNHLLPPHLLHQQSLTLSIPEVPVASNSNGINESSCQGVNVGSPNPQPRTLERGVTSSSLDEQPFNEMDFELVEEMTRQAGHSWLGMGMGMAHLSRSTSASSLTGREAAPTPVSAQ